MAIPAIVAGAASLAGGLLARRSNKREAQRNRDFQERMRSTEWQAGVADMRAAGINPAVAYSQGGASTPSGSQAAPEENQASSAMSNMLIRKQLKMMDEQVREQTAKADSAAVQAWKDRAYRDFFKDNKTIQWPTSEGRNVDITLPGINAFFALQLLREQSGANQARNQASLTQIPADVARRMGNPITSALDMSLDGWAGIGRLLGEKLRRRTGGNR